MAPEAYPAHNPFPSQGTASVEATSRRRLQSAAATVQTAQVRQAWQQVDAYVHPTRTPVPEAGVLALYGAAGTGKTHTVRYLLERLAGEAPDPQRPAPVAAYVLSGGADLDAIRFAILAEIPVAVMRAVSDRYRAVLGLEHADQFHTPRTEEGKAERQRLQGNLVRVGDLLNNALIDPIAVEQVQTRELQIAALGRGELDQPGTPDSGGAEDEWSVDIRNALSYVGHEKLGEKAWGWLCGATLDDNTLLRIGVRAKTRAADHAQRVLRMTVQMFNRSGTPLLVCLDQCETFLRPDPDQPLEVRSVRFLQGLMELLPKERVFLAVAMNMDSWKRLPDYMRQRFGANAIKCDMLTLPAACEFVGAYLRVGAPQDEAPSLFPFEQSAIREILAGVRGNLRGFLQVCHEAFRLAEPARAPITVATVKQALINSGRERPTLEQVRARIDAVLRDRGLDLASGTDASLTTGPARISAMVRRRDGAAVAWLEISESIFIDDEAVQGLTTVDAVKRALDHAARLPVIVMVVGYVSPQVLEQLRLVTPHVWVYESEYLAANLNDSLSRIAIAPVASTTDEDVQRVRTHIVTLEQDRKVEAQQTAVGAIDVLERADRTRIEDAWRVARASWLQERKQTEDQIKSARAARLAEELNGLDWERRRAFRERAQRVATMWGVMAVAVAFIAAFGISDDVLSRIIQRFEVTGVELLLLVFLLATAGGLLQFYVVPTPTRALWAKVPSIDLLNELSARYATASIPSARHLASANPQIRYAAVRSVVGERVEVPLPRRILQSMLTPQRPIHPPDIERIKRTEQNTTVRRALARLARRFGEEIPRDWPERVYAVDDREIREVLDAGLSRYAQTLVNRVWDSEVLQNAYQRGITPDTWEGMSREGSLPQIQGVIRELSPLERPGLGTRDYLRTIAEIDGLYLFFRQWLHYIEFDVPMPRPPVRQ